VFGVTDDLEHLDDYYEDVFLEMAGFGEIEEVYICRNLGDHLSGNCYVKYYDEEDAMKGYVGLRGRYYGGMSAVHGLPSFRYSCAFFCYFLFLCVFGLFYSNDR
jgi:hypothetical protein